MIHPEYRRIDRGADVKTDQYLTPIYPATEGLRQPSLRMLINKALDILVRESSSGSANADDIQGDTNIMCECLPAEILKSLALPPLEQAIQFAHRPSPQSSITSLQEGTHPMLRRLAFEELLVQQLSCKQLRHKTRRLTAPRIAVQGRLRKRFVGRLPDRCTTQGDKGNHK
jgi:ATP-dependent DNA helicase RecG